MLTKTTNYVDLVSAVHSQDLKSLKNLLKSSKGSILELYGYSLLNQAVRHRKFKVVSLLLKNNVRVNKNIPLLSSTPLHHASAQGNLHLVKKLIKMGATVNAQSRNGRTSLQLAAKYGRQNVVKCLLQEGAQSDLEGTAKSNVKMTALHVACIYNRIECAKLLVKHNNSVVSPKNSELIPPILISVVNNNYKLTTILINHVNNLNLPYLENYRDSSYHFEGFEPMDGGLTLLQIAVASDYYSMASLLIDYCADVRTKSTQLGTTALMMAAHNNNPKMVELLLDHCEDNIDDVDEFGNTALHHLFFNQGQDGFSKYSQFAYARHEDKYEVFKKLVDAGANLRAPCCISSHPELTSVLDLAIYYECFMMIVTLLFFTDIGLQQIDYSKIRLAGFDESAISSGEDNNEYIDIRKNNSTTIQRLLATFILSRHHLGFRTEEKTLKIIENLKFEVTSREMDAHYRNELEVLESSVRVLKTIRIGRSKYTLWDIATKKEEIVQFYFNEEFDLLFSDELQNTLDKKQHIFFFHLLKSNINYGKAKGRLLGRNVNGVDILFGDLLPYDCCEKIAVFVTDLNSDYC